jgi:hypothetical protein
MRSLLIGALALSVVAAACAEDDPGIVQPDVNPATVTETFTGTLSVQSVSSHSFIISRSGRITVTLTAVSPPPTSEGPSSPEVGVGIGIPNPSGLTCVLNLGDRTTTTTTAASTPQISGIVIPGTFCVAVYDVGKLTEAVDYTVAVAHP